MIRLSGIGGNRFIYYPTINAENFTWITLSLNFRLFNTRIKNLLSQPIAYPTWAFSNCSLTFGLKARLIPVPAVFASIIALVIQSL